MPARKPVTSLTLSAPQTEWLRAEADRLGISRSDVIRRIVDMAQSWDRNTFAWRETPPAMEPRVRRPPEIARVVKINKPRRP
jgi:hypothetical protein